jgi:hypothetical protein
VTLIIHHDLVYILFQYTTIILVEQLNVLNIYSLYSTDSPAKSVQTDLSLSSPGSDVVSQGLSLRVRTSDLTGYTTIPTTIGQPWQVLACLRLAFHIDYKYSTWRKQIRQRPVAGSRVL